MGIRSTVASLAFVLATSSMPACARQSPDETIIIRLRHPYAICLGVCPNYRMEVSSYGRVATWNLCRRVTHRYRVPSARLAEFRRILAGIRPASESRLDRHCAQASTDAGTADPLDDPHPDDIEIIWAGIDSQVRLTACPGPHQDVRATIFAALNALGAEPATGGPASPSD